MIHFRVVTFFPLAIFGAGEGGEKQTVISCLRCLENTNASVDGGAERRAQEKRLGFEQ